MIIQSIRSLVFYLLFLGQTAILAIVIATIALFAPRRTRLSWALAQYWCHSNIVLLRWIAGVHTRVTGMENIPSGGCIIAAKHQSDWDVFAVFPHTGRPAYVVKKELMRIPFFGAAARSLECIEVDRSKGSQAIPDMLRQARDAVDRGCRIVIFPEGTRRAPLAPPDYKYGIARMYAELGVPVVPVALNSGLFWGRNSPIIWPGLAEAEFLPPIEPGLSKEEFIERLKNAIEVNSNALAVAAEACGLGRPIPPELRERFQALKSADGQPAPTTY